jgi:hypothetical protein
VVHCEFCGKEIGYLPFKCKYCGGIFCKVHRLPENHACSFDKKHVPTTPSPSRSEREEEQYKPIKSSGSRNVDKILRRQKKKQRKARDIFNQSMGRGRMFSVSAATILIFAIFIASIVSLFIPQFTCLSYNSFFGLYLWTFLTAPFVNYTTSYFGIFFLFILILLFYNIIRIIELRFGSRFLLGLFLFSTLIAGVVFFLLLLPVQFFYPASITETIYVGLAYAGLMGIISFLIFSSLNQEMTFLLFFIPIRMKGKTILLLLILLRLIPALLSGLFAPDLFLVYLLMYIPDLGGILGSYIVFRYKTRQRVRLY